MRARGAWLGGTNLLSMSERSREPELMDGDRFDADELSDNLRDIRRVNRMLGGTRVVLRHLPQLLEGAPAHEPVTILDLATGSADIPIDIIRWADAQKRPVNVVASDYSSEMLDVARSETAGVPNITLAQHDARSVRMPDGSVDVVLCSLALHHFDPDDAVLVLKEMDRLGRRGFILNDLRRSRIGFVAAWAAARVTTRNRLTRNDAPLSVRRAYTPAELDALLRSAGIHDAAITTHPVFRMAAVKIRRIPDA